MSFGTKIRNLRIKNKLSQEELADRLQVAQTTVSNIESDKSVPDIIIVQRLCEIFGVGIESLLSSEKEKFVFKKNENNNILVGKIEVLNNNMPEGIIENLIKRVELLEQKLDSFIIK